MTESPPSARRNSGRKRHIDARCEFLNRLLSALVALVGGRRGDLPSRTTSLPDREAVRALRDPYEAGWVYQEGLAKITAGAGTLSSQATDGGKPCPFVAVPGVGATNAPAPNAEASSCSRIRQPKAGFPAFGLCGAAYAASGTARRPSERLAATIAACLCHLARTWRGEHRRSTLPSLRRRRRTAYNAVRVQP